MKLYNSGWSALIVSGLLVLGCGPSSGPGAEGDGGAIEGRGPDGDVNLGDAGLVESVQGCELMDILFVIDDSGSMGEEQVNLAANFPQFVDVINNFRSSHNLPIDYRLAVTTTGVSKKITKRVFGIPTGSSQRGANGELVNRGCSETRDWIERSDATPEETFTCLASVGTGGPDYEMPLEAMRLAIEDRVADGLNTDFYREDALLGVVMLTDENDCSRQDDDFNINFGDNICNNLEPVDTYVSALDNFKGERGRWATAVIAGLTDCSSDLGTAVESTRLVEFASQTGDNAVTSSICDGDLAGALQQALETFDAACESFPIVE